MSWKNWRVISVALVPGLCVGLFIIGKTVFRALVLGGCDVNPECGSELAFAPMAAAAIFALSGVGCGGTAYLSRYTLSQMSAPAVLLLVAVTSVFLLLMFLSAQHWPFFGVGLLISLAILCMVISWLSLLGVKRLTSV